MNEDYRKQYLLHFIQEKYKADMRLSNERLNQFQFSYLAFIINGLKNKQMAFREILKLKQMINNNTSLRQKQRISYFIDLASEEFKLDTSLIRKQNSVRLIDIIQFDEQLEECSTQFKQSLHQKYSLLQTISRNYINLRQLEREAEDLHKNRILLYQNLLTLFKNNSSSIHLQLLCEGYDECLAMEDNFSRLYEQQYRTGRELKNDIPYYSDDSAVVYISMLRDFGKIMKVSKNFHQIVPSVENNKQAIGKNINFMQPDQIAQVHQQILYNSLERKNMNEEIHDYPTILLKDQNGWARPYNLKFQMCMIGKDEFGACGWLKQINDGNIHIMTSSLKHSLNIFILDFELYSKIFNGHISQHDTNKIKLGNIIPMLKNIIQRGKSSMIYETILIQPSTLTEALVDRGDYDLLSKQELMEMNLYQIQFTFFCVDNAFIQFVQYQIVSINPLTDFGQKKEAIKNFKMIFKQYQKKLIPSDKIQKDLNDNNSIDLQNSENNIGESLNKQAIQLSIEQGEEQQQIERDTSINKNQRKIKIDLNQIGLLSQNSQINSLKQIKDGQSSRKIKQGEFTPIYCEQTSYTNPFQKELSLLQTLEIKSESTRTDSSQKKINSQQTIQSFQNGQMISALGSDKNIQPMTTIDTHRSINIVSSDSLFFSPLSSHRKGLFSSDTIRQQQPMPKDDNHQIKNTILENSVEDENISNLKYIQKLKKQVSLSDKVKTLNQQNIIQDIIPNYDLSSNSKQTRQIEEPISPLFMEDRDKDGSVKTNISQNSSTKAQLINSIKSHSQSNGLRFINILGIVAITIICVLNVQSYWSQASEQSRQKKNFQQIFWCYQVKRYSMLVFGNSGLVKSIQNNHYYFATVADQTYGMKLLKYTNIYLFTGYKNLTQELIEGNSKDVDVFNKVNQFKVVHSFPSTLNALQTTKVTTTLSYMMIYFQNYAYYITYLQDGMRYNEAAARANSQTIYKALDQVYASNSDIFYSYLKQTQFIISIQLILIPIVTVIFSILVIPIYAISQAKREKNLKLFATFSPDKISFMMNSIHKFLEKQVKIDQLKKRNNLQHRISISNQQNQNLQHNLKNHYSQFILKNSQDQQHIKRRNISSTNGIPRTNKKVMIGIIICIILNQIYPITNYIVTQQSVESFRQNLEFLNQFNYFYDNITTLVNMKYVITFAMLNPNTPRSIQQDYISFTQPVKAQTSNLFNSLIKAYSEFESFNGYGKEEYQNFLNPIFKRNICDTLFKTGQNHFRDVNISYEKCNILAGGVFQQGLLVTFKKIISIYETFFEAAFSNDVQTFQKTLKDMQLDLKITEEYEFLQYTLLLSKVVHYFFQDTYNLQFIYYTKLALIIISIQMVIVFIVMVFGWRMFFKIIGQQYFESKQLFDFIDINILLDNPYVVSNFKRNL